MIPIVVVPSGCPWGQGNDDTPYIPSITRAWCSACGEEYLGSVYGPLKEGLRCVGYRYETCSSCRTRLLGRDRRVGPMQTSIRQRMPEPILS